MAAVVDDSLHEEHQLSDRGVEVRADPFFRDVSLRTGYELIVAEFEVEARQRAAPAWRPHLDDLSGVERLVQSELLRRSISVRADDDLVRDLAQDVRLRVHEKLHLFEHRGDATFDGWLRIVTREVLRHRLSRYLPSNVPIAEVEEHRLGVNEGFEQNVVDRLVLTSLVHILRSEPRLGDVVEKRRKGEVLNDEERVRWMRNVHRLVELCEQMGVHGWEISR